MPTATEFKAILLVTIPENEETSPSGNQDKSAEPPAGSTAASDTGLPELEPLTPELVEDEAVRGDFMIRWVVVLLAVLLGCSTIGETDTLVRIRTGEHIAAHGWLPPRTDPFAYTTQGRPWINTAWLFDLLITGLHSIFGSAGLTLVKAGLAGVVFLLLSRITKPRASTWWGSVCAGLALLAVHPRLTVRPEFITLLGVAITLWILHRWRDGGKANELWALPAVFLLWGNLDPRMFLGPAVLALYAIGDVVGDKFAGSRLSGPQRRQLWMVLGVGLIATLVNPFGWHAILSPLTVYGVEYPVFREYFAISKSPALAAYLPLYDITVWKSPSVQTLAGATLLWITAIVLMLNRRNVDWGHVFVFVGVVAAAVVAGHELAFAAVVCVVLATLNAQEWYGTTFRQTYSLEPSELLFSRGGRAATVLALFAVAVLAVSGRIGGSGVGMGLHHELVSASKSLQKVEQAAFDARPFPFSLQQGNLLIWNGQQTFADTRIALLHGKGDDNLLALHQTIRDALRSGKNAPLWRKSFDRFKVTHVIPRLYGKQPDYASYFALLISPDWRLAKLDSATGVFYRLESDGNAPDSPLRKYLAEHQVNFVKEAFQTSDKKTTECLDWARPIGWYSNFLSKQDNPTPPAIRVAMHYREHLQLNYVEPSTPTALAYLAIRNANKGLVENPQDANGYLVLGDAYRFLGRLESRLAGPRVSATLRTMRYFQMVAAYRQARILRPNEPEVVRRLYGAFLERGRYDAALHALSDYQQLTANLVSTDPAIKQRTEADVRDAEQLSKIIKEADERIDRILGTRQGKVETAKLTAAQTAFAAGQIEKALELTEEVLLSSSSQVEARVFHVALLLENGRDEEALAEVSSLEQTLGLNTIPQLRTFVAYAALGHAEYERAATLWQDEADEMEQQVAQVLFDSLPMSGSTKLLPPRISPRDWPLSQFQSLGAQYSLSFVTAESLLRAAICHMEAGQPKKAEVLLRRIMRDSPETLLRPVVWLYTTVTTGEQFPLDPPSNRIPITPDLFETETDSGKAPTNKASKDKSKSTPQPKQ
jgi:tetratricopeptide (TPR) repeat protein